MSSTRQRRSAYLVLAMMMVPAIFVAAVPSAPGQTFTVIHTFKGGADGAGPNGDLSIGATVDGRESLFGTTANGGSGTCSGGCGTVFKIGRDGKEKVLYSFTNTPDGANPNGGLVRDPAGSWYGTTASGGTFGFGTVFKLDNTNKETVLYSFTGGTDGQKPNGSLVRDAAGNLYGTTILGGIVNCDGAGCGVVFKVDKTGKETVLYSFSGGYRGPDGAWPDAGVIRDAAGNLYGTTNWGGPSVYGAVFKITGDQETVLYGFSDEPDGRYPTAPLLEDAAGNLYGTTELGGQGNCYAGLGCGIVFKLDTTGTETVLHRFTGPPDGAEPTAAGLISDTAGNLYGTTFWGGVSKCLGGCGTVFELDTTGTLTVLYSFSGRNDGAYPVGGLVADSSGKLYGTASGGGHRRQGVVFRITPK